MTKFHRHINDPHTCLAVPDCGIAWVGLLKNASSSILKALRRLPEPHFYVGPAELGPYWSFAVVRNPYTRVASVWAHKCFYGWKPPMGAVGITRGMEFPAFIATICARPDESCVGNQAQHWRSQTVDLAHGVDHLGRFEALADTWSEVRRRSAVDPGPLAHLHRTTTPAPWTPALRDAVAHRYAADFAALGYHR
jgi:hypothetical protein